MGLPGHRRQTGFTITELVIWIGVAISVMMAATASYIGTTKSWEGTAGLARVQQEGSLAVEMMARSVREGSSVTIGSGGNSMSVYYWTGSLDSLMARYRLNDQGCVEDSYGHVIASDVDSMRIASSDGQVVNIDLYLRDDRETTNHAGDDLPVVLSSTAVCRN